MDKLPRAERERTANIGFVLGRAEHYHGRLVFLRRLQRKNRVARNLRDVQIQDDEIGVEIRLFQDLQRLLPIAGDVKMDRRWAI